MSKQVTLSSPRYRVVLGDWSDPDTWVDHEVQAIGRDLQMAETLFAKHREWGKYTDQGVKLTAVAAFYACKRTGVFAGNWDEFENSYLEVTEAGAVEVGPTNQAAGDD